MARKLIVLLALAVLFVFAGCDYLDINVEDLDSSPSSQVGGTGQEAPTEAPVSPDAQASSAPQDAVPPLTDEDFSVAADDLTITIGMDPAPVIEALGEGGADEDNNYGFVGWDETNQYKFYRRDYDGFGIFVKTDVAAGTSVVSQIAVTGMDTHRGIAPGDTYEDMVAQYGEPDSEATDEGMTSYTYHAGDRVMTVVTDESGVIGYIDIV